tara:strand:+ start:312 stop:470 length:159 start_codon:yes stop_codon:yes gene_type:complete
VSVDGLGIEHGFGLLFGVKILVVEFGHLVHESECLGVALSVAPWRGWGCKIA